MEAINGAGAPPSVPSDSQQQTGQAGQSEMTAEQKAAFDKAVEEFAGGELLADHFMLQGLIDETMKDSTSS